MGVGGGDKQGNRTSGVWDRGYSSLYTKYLGVPEVGIKQRYRWR